jgi:DNA-binding CsgD family transcriptional regulator
VWESADPETIERAFAGQFPGAGQRRVRTVLVSLLRGRSEKQVAGEMGISRHTVHVYVRQIYKLYHVDSRTSLFAFFLAIALAREPEPAASGSAAGSWGSLDGPVRLRRFRRRLVVRTSTVRVSA